MSQGLRNESYPEFSIFGPEFTNITITPPLPLSFYVSPSLFSLSPHPLSVHPSLCLSPSEGHCWCMNGVQWPQSLPCITDASASGWTPGSARKNARNAKNGPVSDKKEIPRNSVDQEPRDNTDSHWGEKKRMTTKSGIGRDGTGCLDGYRS